MCSSGKRVPAYPPRVLQIPPVHVVKLFQVQVVARDEARPRRWSRLPVRSRRHRPPAISLAKRPTKPACGAQLIGKVRIRTVRRPRARIARPDQRDTVPQEDVGICGCEAGPPEICHTLWSSLSRHFAPPYRGAASSIASSNRFSSLPFG